MKRKKNNKRDMDKIGKEQFLFDLDQEKAIYDYLCGYITRRDWRKYYDKCLITRYTDWKKSIYNKYENYSEIELVEFEKYLIQMSRVREIGNITLQNFLLPIMIGIYLPFYTFIINDPVSGMLNFVIGLVFIALAGYVLSYYAVKITHQFKSKKIFILDYFEIIKELCENKK